MFIVLIKTGLRRVHILQRQGERIVKGEFEDFAFIR